MTNTRVHPTAFGALRIVNYRLFVAGQAISLVGSWTETIAQSILMLRLTDSPIELGIAVAFRYLPVLLLGPYAGVVVDRHDRRRMLIFTQASLAVASLVLGTVVLSGAVTVWWVYAIALAFGTLTALDNPSRMALIPEIVPKDQLHSAITLNAILANVGRGVGPVVAATLIATIGIGWCFIINAASFAAVITSLLLMRLAGIRSEGRINRQRGQLRDAVRVAKRNPEIIGPLAMMALIGTFTFEFEVSLPVFAERSLDAGAVEYSWLTAGFGLGAVIAGIVLMFRPQVGVRRLTVIAALYGVAVGVAAFSPSPLFANVVIVFVGGASIAFLTTGNSTIQLAAPAGMRGRITSLWTTAFIGSTPIGALLVGTIAQSLGGRAAVLVGAVAAILAALVAVSVIRLVPALGPDTADPPSEARM